MKKIFLTNMFLLALYASFAQQVGIGTNSPNSKALLDLTSNNKGLLVPRMSAAERIAINPANPAKGLLVFDNDSTAFMFWTGTAWQKIASAATGSSGNAWLVSGNAATAADVLGTNNNQPLVLVANGLQIAKLEHKNNFGFHAPNITMGSKGNSITRSVSSAILSGGVENLGYENTIDSSYYAVIAGGDNQEMYLAGNSFIGGGISNAIKSLDANDVINNTIAGGNNNTINSNYGTIAGGSNNDITKRNGFVGGGFDNIAGEYSTIAGGKKNTNNGDSSFIGGGSYNTIAGNFSNVISGGFNNAISSLGATIAGGYVNTVTGSYGVIGGGYENYMNNSGSNSVIAGGYKDSIMGLYGAIGGGNNNKIAAGSYSTISGGINNATSQIGSVISGGGNNSVTGKYSTVGGGYGNETKGDSSVIAGGRNNTVNAPSHNSFIGGGTNNIVQVQYSTIAGGRNNLTAEFASFIGGGQYNIAYGRYSTITAGTNNTAGDEGASVGGGANHMAYGLYSTVSGGYNNTIGSDIGIIAGGNENRILGNAPFSFIGGGDTNVIDTRNSSIAGGLRNKISLTGDYSAIAGGRDNRIEKVYSFIGGGDNNWSRGQYSSVLGGNSNESGGDYSTVLNGSGNVAGGLYSLSAGKNCENQHNYVAMFTDGQSERFNSRVSSQFMIRMTNGLFVTQEDTSSINEGFVQIRSRAALPNLLIDQVNASANYARIRLRTIQNKTNYWDIAAQSVSGEFNIYRNGTGNVMSLTPTDATNLLMMSNNARLTIGGTWTNASDRNVKDRITIVDEDKILTKLVNMPVTMWHYKTEQANVMHIGPMAQDFKAAFNLGDSDKSIATVDADGVNMLAIKALYKQLQKANEEIDKLKKEVKKLQHK
jgi:hypothetical protein